ncbi:MAG: ABC transporter ATP-binding protein [Gemmatimonadota bacterium]|nr:ABC transporter ATP-binding protein [Gemmatimonadota bacterium]
MAQRTLRRLLQVARPYRGTFGLGLIASFIASALDGFTVVLLVPLLQQLFGTAGALEVDATRLERITSFLVDPWTAGLSSGAAVARMALLLSAALLIKNAMVYAAAQLSVRVQQGLVRDLRTRLYDHLLTIDLGFFQRTRAGHLISGVIADADAAKSVVSAAQASLFQNLVLILATFSIMAAASPRLTLLTLLTAPILVLGIQQVLVRLRRHAKVWAVHRGELTGTVSERLGAIKLIRAYGAEAEEGEHFARQAETYRKGLIRIERFSSLTSPVSEIFGGLVVILILWATTNPAITGVVLEPAVTIVFLLAALRIMSPLKKLSSFPAVMAVAMASADRVFELLDLPSQESEHPGDRGATFGREVRFEGVSFRYEPDAADVLHEVSFAVPRGSVVALVGPSGAGKSTLLDLVARFHDPTGGRILLDDTPLTELNRHSLRGLMGIVSQDTVLLNDTVAANIAYGRPGASLVDIAAAAEAANAMEFIAALPEGMNTLLGERGTRLSGGQRQRIAIARALLRDPPILMLDEATSALDTESERLVQGAIDRLMRDRTVLVVAHRLATVRGADAIVVLQEGQVVEQGDHAALLAQGGLYARLHDLQFRDPQAEAGT